jgi:hypothetical protein
VPRKYPSDLSSLSFQHDLTSRSAQKRRSVTNPARGVSAGEEADRKFFQFRPSRSYGLRPIGNAELNALLELRGLKVPPGVRRPKTYAAMATCIYADRTKISRIIHVNLKSRMWKGLVQDACIGVVPSDGVAEGWFKPASGTVFLADISALPLAAGTL